MNKLFKTTIQLLAGLAALLAMGSAIPASVTISSVPLATSSGANILPNLLFTLDGSGSMGWDYLPDYVNDTQKCMTNSAGGTTCSYGDPPWQTGGATGFNGVAYDPRVYYRPGVDWLGNTVLNWTATTKTTSSPLPTTALVADAYLGGSTINLTSGITDRRYCNANSVCKRNGTDAAGTTLVSGTDASGNTMSAGRFPYRTHASNASTLVFGLPEMMPMGVMTRSATTVTVTTTGVHGLAVNDIIYITGTGVTGIDGNTITVATVPGTRSFTFTSGTASAATTASFVRATSTVTVTSTGHGLSTGNLVTIVTGNANLDATATPIVRISANAFSYQMAGTVTVSSTSGTWNLGSTGSFRKHVTGAAWTSPATGTTAQKSVVTVTSNGHGLVTNDSIYFQNTDTNATGTANVTVLNANTFTYSAPVGVPATQAGTTSWIRTGLYNVASAINGPAMAYTITPIEYCTDANLTNCVEVIPPASAPGGYTFPAYVRFCQTQDQATALGGVGDASGVPRCRNKFVASGNIAAIYSWPRYGWYNREVIQSATTSYANRPDRSDCAAAPSCTYTEEIQNYARWYTFYRTRIQMMKTAAGRSFLPFVSNPSAAVPIPNKVRVGFINIEPFYPSQSGSKGSGVQPENYLKIDNFDTTQASNWYDKFYKQVVNQSTPLREALSRAGWIFAGKLNTGLTNGIPLTDDPIQASCQRNYTLLTTDGYWNGNGGQDLAGTAMGNADNRNNDLQSPYSQVMVDRANTGTFDGGVGTVVTTTTPTNTLEQNICFGNASTTFSAGTQTTCGCSGTQQRSWTRTLTASNIVATTDGVLTSNTNTNTATFAADVACQAAYTSTSKVTTTITDQRAVRVTALSTFPTVNGQATGANGVAANIAGTCASNFGQIITRITTYDTTTVSTNGVAAAPTVGNTRYDFTTTPPTSCQALTTVTVRNSVQETQQVNKTLTNGGAGSTTLSFTPAAAPTGFTVVTAVGATGPTVFSPSAQETTTVNCTSVPGTGSAPNNIRWVRYQRVLSYTRTDTQSGSAAVTSTYGTATASFTRPASSCTTTAQTLTNGSATITAAGSVASTTISGDPVPNAVSTSVGSATITGTTGTQLTITRSPNPSTPAVGTPSVATSYGGYPNTLADVAMYYYRTDLRGGTDIFGNSTGPSLNLGGTGTVDISPNNIPVKAGAKDFATHQHMTTFTIGLADGFMRYQPSYETDTTGDFVNIKNGAAAGTCFWTTGVCNWPQPFADDASALDDLWHAGVNGRGSFFSALNVDGLVSGIANTLNSVNAQVASASASATSSPNVTQTDNQIFSTTYQTITWGGKVFAQTIDPATGNVLSTITWQADTQLLTKVSSASDTRSIYTLDTSGVNPDNIKPFLWSVTTPTVSNPGLTATEQGYFTNKCVPTTGMTQCSGLTTAQAVIANNGSALQAFIRGQFGNEATVFRDRTYLDSVSGTILNTVLGDTITAKPAYLRGSINNYTDTGYSSFITTNSTRAARVFVGANDGFLHALNALTGDEVYAYTPRFLMPSLYQLADTGYPTSHRYYVDGSPETADVYDSTAGVWKTILVGGTGGGGAGFYALDVTDANTPKALWEFCSSASLCASSDNDLGLAYGNPVIGKRAYDGKWVVIVTSGLNNTSGTNPGKGYFYVLDAITGTLLHKVAVGASLGSATTPLGLMKMSAYYDNALSDATFRYVYAGDQLGNVWRMDMLAAPTAPATVATPRPTPTVMHLASLKDGSARAQPITTRPALTHIGTDRIVYVGTGRFLGAPDLTDPGAGSGIAWQQSLYAFKDTDTDYGTSGNGLRANSNMYRQTLSSLSPTTRGITANVTPVTFAAPQIGWYMDFNPSFSGVADSPGEGVNLVDPKLVLGTLVVTTNAPAQGSSSCSVGGSSFFYNIDFKTGLAVSTSAGGVVGQSLGGTITVGVAIVQLPSGAIKSINTGADTTKTTAGVNTSASGAQVKRFSYRVR